MHSLKFRVLITTPPQYGQNGTAHAAGASILLPARESSPACIVRGTACGVQWAWQITAGLCHAFPQCCHSNATRALIANPLNGAQQTNVTDRTDIQTTVRQHRANNFTNGRPKTKHDYKVTRNNLNNSKLKYTHKKTITKHPQTWFKRLLCHQETGSILQPQNHHRENKTKTGSQYQKLRLNVKKT